MKTFDYLGMQKLAKGSDTIGKMVNQLKPGLKDTIEKDGVPEVKGRKKMSAEQYVDYESHRLVHKVLDEDETLQKFRDRYDKLVDSAD